MNRDMKNFSKFPSSIEKLSEISRSVYYFNLPGMTGEWYPLLEELFGYLMPLSTRSFTVTIKGTRLDTYLHGDVVVVSRKMIYVRKMFPENGYKSQLSGVQLFWLLAELGDSLVKSARKDIADDVSSVVKLVRKWLSRYNKEITFNMENKAFISDIYDRRGEFNRISDYLVVNSRGVYLSSHRKGYPDMTFMDQIWSEELHQIVKWEYFMQLHASMARAIDKYMSKNAGELKVETEEGSRMIDELIKMVKVGRTEKILYE